MFNLIDTRWDPALRELRRMWPLVILFLITFLIVLALNPMKAGLTLFGISKVALGGLIGYVIDRCVFRAEDRPHILEGISRGAAWKRRSLIVAAAILALGFVP